MADEKKDKDTTANPVASEKPWWQELLSAMPWWVYWSIGIELAGALLLAAYSTDKGRRLMKVLTEKVWPEMWKTVEDKFRLLELIVYLLANMVFIIDGFILLQFGRQALGFLWWGWPNTLINRVVGGLPVMLLLQALLFFPLVRMAKWLIAVGVAEGFLRRDGLDEKIVTRFVRMVAKLNAWHALGFVLVALPPFHKWPELLAIGVVLVPVWPYFCNAWRAGDSEHLRRIILSVMGWTTVNAVLLATLHPVVKVPFLAFYNGQFNWIGLAITVVFLMQVAGAWTSGARKTATDQAWEAEREENVHLRRLARRRKLIKRGVIDPSDVSQLGSMAAPPPTKERTVTGDGRGYQTAGYVFPSQRYIQPRRMHPAIIVLLIAAGLWVGLYLMDPSHQPMVPYQWILGK